MEQNIIDRIKSNWNEVLDYIRNEFEIAEISFNIWISPLKPSYTEKDENGGTVLAIQVPDTQNLPAFVFRNMLTRKYAPYILVAIEEKTGIKCTGLKYVTDEGNQTQAQGKLIDPVQRKVDPATLSIANLNPRYTFDTFVVGQNNNIAHAASLAVAENPGGLYNPLFIYGGVGLGKTHLMQSIAHFVLQENPGAKIRYVTSEVFTNDLIDAIRSKNNYTTTEFRNKYRNNDVLLIDDIQFIIGKESTQEEFFHTFNTLYEAKKQIIISSDKPPKDFEMLEERLRSRFEWGLTVDIKPPDYETRMAILRKKEELDGINIDNEVLQYIASNIKSNIRELEGSLNKVVAMSKLDNREINVEMAQDVLKDIIDPGAKPEITPRSGWTEEKQGDRLSAPGRHVSLQGDDERAASADRPVPRRKRPYHNYPRHGKDFHRDQGKTRCGIHDLDPEEKDLRTVINIFSLLLQTVSTEAGRTKNTAETKGRDMFSQIHSP